jgi:MarR family transcriptional regulator, lower aerobic nicotinate degradation pathway regulator
VGTLPVVSQPSHLSSPLFQFLLRRVYLETQEALAELGLRQRHYVAMNVLRKYGASTQQSLPQTLQINRTNVVALLNELEDQGLIERRRSSEDRRRHTIHLTELGLERLAKAELAHINVENQVLRALNPEERESLYELLLKAVDDQSIADAREMHLR